MFYVGQKVGLIKAYGDREQAIAAAYNFSLPRVGTTYTVRVIVDGTHIRLAEIVNPDVPYVEGDMEPLWLASRFHPVVERKTDISALKALLNPSDERVSA